MQPCDVTYIFAVERCLACGAFGIISAKLVANRRTQDPMHYPDNSSPTISILPFLNLLVFTGSTGWKAIVEKRITDERINVEYRHTSRILADGWNKPLFFF